MGKKIAEYKVNKIRQQKAKKLKLNTKKNRALFEVERQKDQRKLKLNEKQEIFQKKKKKLGQKKQKAINDNDNTEKNVNYLQCQIHNDRPIEFICKQNYCMKQLCGLCILDHKQHIQYIENIRNIIVEFKKSFTVNNPQQITNQIVRNGENNLKQLDFLLKNITDTISTKINNLKDQIYQNVQLSTSLVSGINNYRIPRNKKKQQQMNINENTIKLVKDYIQFTEQNQNIGLISSINENAMNNSRQNNYQLIIDNKNVNQMMTLNLQFNIDLLQSDINSTLDNNIYIQKDEQSLESTKFGYPKVLHWFEWGKKRLNLYNIISHTTKIIDLDIQYKIPSFSRSILLPDAKIYLMGGEEPEYFSRREVFLFDIMLNDNKLQTKANMPRKKFDFALCYSKGYIYCFCGKDGQSEIVDYCEKYNVEDDQWTIIAPVMHKRYAASAIGCSNGRIFLFGGRTDINNSMASEIEEYNDQTNTWSIVNLRDISIWSPVEVCACIEIYQDQILMFGGSDARIKDTNNSVLFNSREYTFQKIEDIKIPQVFVTAPFLMGKYIYAIGNEYYQKHRNLHRFSIEKQQWEIIF